MNMNQLGRVKSNLLGRPSEEIKCELSNLYWSLQLSRLLKCLGSIPVVKILEPKHMKSFGFDHI